MITGADIEANRLEQEIAGRGIDDSGSVRQASHRNAFAIADNP